MSSQGNKAFANHHGLFLWAIGFIAFSLLTIWPAFLLRTDLAVSGDDASYVSHAFTIGLDFDLDYSNELSSSDDYFKVADRMMPSHPIGPGIIAAPFVALFSIIDRLNGHPVISDHSSYLYSWSYFGFFFASSLSLLIGTILYSFAFKQWLSKKEWMLPALLVASSGIIFYCHGRFTMAHSFEFLMFSIVFFLSKKLTENPARSTSEWICLVTTLAISSVLALLTRYANVQVLLLPLITVALFNIDEKIDKKIYWSIIAAIAATAIVFTLVSFALYGMPFPRFSGIYSNSAKAKIFESASLIFRTVRMLPNLVPLFFGSEFGLVWSFPAAFFGCLGAILYVLRTIRGSANLARKFVDIAAIIVYFSIPFVIVLNWQTTASSYGFRYLYSIMPLGLACSLLLWQSQTVTSGSTATRATGIIIRSMIVVTCILGCLASFLFLANPGLVPRLQENVFGVMHQYSANGYFGNYIKSVLDLKTWIIASGRTALAFFGAVFVLHVGEKISLLPANLIIKFAEYYKDHPLVFFVQLCLVALAWGILGAIAVKKWRTNEANHPSTML